MTVLTITTNATHAENLLDHVKKHVEPRYQPFFAFQHETSFGTHWRVPKYLLFDLLNKPWITATGAKKIGAP